MTDPPSNSGLTPFQLEMAELFFNMPTSRGFLLAGGGALLAQNLTSRPTFDLDFFTSPQGETVSKAAQSLIEATKQRGWQIETLRDHETFRRLVIHGPEDLVIDLALDSVPELDIAASSAGPTFHREELAGRKVIALFNRAAARDFLDVYVLSRTFDKGLMLQRAWEVDHGFSEVVFAQMLEMLNRYSDFDLGLDPTLDPVQVRNFFASWAQQLRSSGK